MKNTAILINNSRGPVVDELALINALKNKSIAGAGLDVFLNEPIKMDNPLLKYNNVVLLPHISSGSIETRTTMAMLAANSIATALRGAVPENLVNRQVLRR